MFLQIAKAEPKKEHIYQNEEAIMKISSFGLTYEDFESTAILAVKEYNQLSKYAYSLDRNTIFFFSLIRNFRERLCIKGWAIEDKFNLNRTLTPNKNIAFVFSSGDKNVCSITNTPMTKNKKGEVSLATVEMNNTIQLSMLKDLFQGEEIIPEKYDIGEMQHWFILFYKFKNKVWIEISLPKGIDKKTNKISEWTERIILPVIEYKEDLISESKSLPNNMTTASCYNKEDELNITRK